MRYARASLTLASADCITSRASLHVASADCITFGLSSAGFGCTVPQTDQVLDPFLAPTSQPSDETQTDRPPGKAPAPYVPLQRAATEDVGTDGIPDGIDDFDYKVRAQASTCGSKVTTPDDCVTISCCMTIHVCLRYNEH